MRVVAAALYDKAGRVLIAERPAGKHMAGRWEFPGGKIAADESEAQALARELHEELGVIVGPCHRFMSLSHAYEDRLVELALWVVLSYSGEPAPLEGQCLKWVPPQELPAEDILEADRPFVAALARLPPPAAGAAPILRSFRDGCVE